MLKSRSFDSDLTNIRKKCLAWLLFLYLVCCCNVQLSGANHCPNSYNSNYWIFPCQASDFHNERYVGPHIKSLDTNSIQEGLIKKDNRAHTISYSLGWPPYSSTTSPIPKSKISTDVFPIVALGINYINKSNIKFGISFSRSEAFSSDTFYVSPLANHPYDQVDIQNYQLVFTADYIYFRNARINLYSGGALGYCITKREGSHGGTISGIRYQYVDFQEQIAWQINAIGVNYFPFKNFGIICEVGYGYAGIIKAGLLCRFKVK